MTPGRSSSVRTEMYLLPLSVTSGRSLSPAMARWPTSELSDFTSNSYESGPRVVCRTFTEPGVSPSAGVTSSAASATHRCTVDPPSSGSVAAVSIAATANEDAATSYSNQSQYPASAVGAGSTYQSGKASGASSGAYASRPNASGAHAALFAYSDPSGM